MADQQASRRAFSDETTTVGVIGGGAWGTALGMHCARMGHPTLIWAREPEVVRDINDPAVRENTVFLKVRCLHLIAHLLFTCRCLVGPC